MGQDRWASYPQEERLKDGERASRQRQKRTDTNTQQEEEEDDDDDDSFADFKEKFAKLKCSLLRITHTIRITRTKVYVIYSVYLSLQLKAYIVKNNTFPNCKHCPVEGKQQRDLLVTV
jgi:hypothetical protein